MLFFRLSLINHYIKLLMYFFLKKFKYYLKKIISIFSRKRKKETKQDDIYPLW